ncbi:Hypothetical predicted protein [Pelobates cultripes]|uniref:Uncharacterized protein n=1 Tax=Pelobates cultripes TaxID=61616 RepID=A0AAD1WJ40_PELCU|nr:Hypothetical predicted protein [Pelobates cultripes]
MGIIYRVARGAARLQRPGNRGGGGSREGGEEPAAPGPVLGVLIKASGPHGCCLF